MAAYITRVGRNPSSCRVYFSSPPSFTSLVRAFHKQGCVRHQVPSLHFVKSGCNGQAFGITARPGIKSLYSRTAITLLNARLSSTSTDAAAATPTATTAQPSATAAVEPATSAAVTPPVAESVPIQPVIPTPATSPVITDTITAVDPAAVATSTPWYETNLLMSLVDYVHTSLDIPLFLSMGAIALGIRLALIPLTVHMSVNNAKVSMLKAQYDEFKIRAKGAIAYGESQDILNIMMSKMQEVFVINKCRPERGFIMPAINLQLFMLFGYSSVLGSSALQGVDPVLPWLTDLGSPDPLLLLPFSACLLLFGNMWISRRSGTFPSTLPLVPKGYALHVMCLVLVPITAQLPAIFFAYWIPAVLCNFTVQSALMLPKVRKLVGITEKPKGPTVFHSEAEPVEQEDLDEVVREIEESLTEPKAEDEVIEDPDELLEDETPVVPPKKVKKKKNVIRYNQQFHSRKAHKIYKKQQEDLLKGEPVTNQ